MRQSVRRLRSRLSGICEENVNCPFIPGARKRTTKAQRPGPPDATIATTTLSPGSLERIVRPRCHGREINALTMKVIISAAPKIGIGAVGSPKTIQRGALKKRAIAQITPTTAAKIKAGMMNVPIMCKAA
jgi:hypothetical protein